MRIRWKERFKNLRLSGKMMLVYSIFAVITCIISMIALQTSLNIYDEKLYEKSFQELDYFTQQVNQSLEEIEDLSYAIAMSNEVQEQLTKMNSIKYMSAEYAYEIYHLRGIIMEDLNLHPLIKNIIYTDKKQVEIKVGTDTGILNKNTKNNILSQFQEKKGGYASKNPSKEYPYLLSGRDIMKWKNATLDYLGSIILTSDVTGVIEEKIDSLEAVHPILFVYSEDEIIYQDKEVEIPKLPSLDQTKGYEIIRLNGQKYFMCYLKSSINGWMYVNLFPYTEIYGQTVMVRYSLLVGFVIIFILMLIAMKKVSVIITRPLNRLSESMRIVETGDFQGAKLVLKYGIQNDEVGFLAQEFQVMLEKIDVLIHENYEKELLLQKTKYKMLRAQINPHFLYNTLNALNWMVRGERNEDAVKVIMELGQLLRASFSKNPYTTVEEELKVAKGYITIQKYRYQGRVEFTIETEGRLDGYMIPCMIIQPLIENAIYYGVENSLDCCHVKVRAIEEKDTILIEVEDSGKGMSQEELERISAGNFEPKGNGIGLENIKERLKITYKDSEFIMESKLGRGTQIHIRIPKIEMEGEHV
ncbi:MAG: sensor histidine kinase [Clostridium sp.]|uniref:sensor histidine kinase n=1 Tax=Clostridium sp. TaxID=1506 RepID=UPI00290EC55D|nr:sensor histidine kinase [Clostridium sp.]MDU5109907.1 sensor histidine kinase [Clostridium sp.]